MRSLVMSDVETRTEWSHLLGRGMAGKLKGKVLKPLITDMLTWAAWKEEFPATTVLNMSNKRDNYTRDFYADPSKWDRCSHFQGWCNADPYGAVE